MFGICAPTRLAVAALLSISILSLAAGPADNKPVDPATLPWAMRVLPNRKTMYLVAHAPIGIELPDELKCGAAGGIPAMIDPKGGMDFIVWAEANTAATQPATRPATGDDASATPLPTLAQIGALLAPLQLTPSGAPLVAEPNGGFQMAFLNCHKQPATIVGGGRVVGNYVVRIVVAVPATDPSAAEAAASNLELLLRRAKVVQRRAVNGNFEVCPPTVAPTPSPAIAHASATATPTAIPGAATATPAMTAGSSAVARGPLTPAAIHLNAQAATALAAAAKLKEDGKDASAYDHFRYVVRQYPRTPAAMQAQAAVAAYEADPDFMAAYKTKGAAEAPATRPATVAPTATPAQRAASLLSLADQYATSGRTDLARKKYQAIIDQYPTLPAASTARDRLAKLPANP